MCLKCFKIKIGIFSRLKNYIQDRLRYDIIKEIRHLKDFLQEYPQYFLRYKLHQENNLLAKNYVKERNQNKI